MKKTFVSNLALLMGVNLLIKPFWILGIDRGVQNQLGYETYGMYSNLFAFSLLFITLLDLGINNFTSSKIAKNKENLQAYFGTLFLFKLAASAIYFGITIVLGKLYGFDSIRIKLLFLLGLNQILSYFYLFFRSVAGGLQLFKADAFLSVTDRILMIALCGIMLWSGLFNLSITRFIYAQTISYLFATGMAIWVIKPYLNAIKLVAKKDTIISILRQMWPYALLSLLMTVYTRVDNILIQKLLENGDYHNGVYASAFRLLEAANMMAVLVSMLLLPIFSKMIETRQPLAPMVQLSTSIMVIPALVFCLGCYWYKEGIMQALYPHSTTYAINTFGMVMFCFVAYAFMYVYGTLLTANGSLKTLNTLATIALLINFAANFWLIPKYQAFGAAIAAVLTQFFIGITNTFFGIARLKLHFQHNYIKKLLLAAIFLMVSSYGISLIVTHWLTGLIINLSLGAAAMLLFKLVEPTDAIKLFKERL